VKIGVDFWVDKPGLTEIFGTILNRWRADRVSINRNVNISSLDGVYVRENAVIKYNFDTNKPRKHRIDSTHSIE